MMNNVLKGARKVRFGVNRIKYAFNAKVSCKLQLITNVLKDAKIQSFVTGMKRKVNVWDVIKTGKRCIRRAVSTNVTQTKYGTEKRNNV
jgi:hypothetical protein